MPPPVIVHPSTLLNGQTLCSRNPSTVRGGPVLSSRNPFPLPYHPPPTPPLPLGTFLTYPPAVFEGWFCPPIRSSPVLDARVCFACVSRVCSSSVSGGLRRMLAYFGNAAHLLGPVQDSQQRRHRRPDGDRLLLAPQPLRSHQLWGPAVQWVPSFPVMHPDIVQLYLRRIHRGMLVVIAISVCL